MAKWQRFRIDIPKGYTPTERVAIAEEVVDFVISRTKKGLDKNNSSFAPYTKEYKGSKNFEIAGKSSKVNLTLSGETLNSLDLVSHNNGSLLIGYDRSDKELNGKVEGNVIGSYGQSSGDSDKARDFMGISKKDLAKILEKFPKKTESEKRKTRQKAIEIVSSISEAREAINE